MGIGRRFPRKFTINSSARKKTKVTPKVAKMASKRDPKREPKSPKCGLGALPKYGPNNIKK